MGRLSADLYVIGTSLCVVTGASESDYSEIWRFINMYIDGSLID